MRSHRRARSWRQDVPTLSHTARSSEQDPSRSVSCSHVLEGKQSGTHLCLYRKISKPDPASPNLNLAEAWQMSFYRCVCAPSMRCPRRAALTSEPDSAIPQGPFTVLALVVFSAKVAWKVTDNCFSSTWLLANSHKPYFGKQRRMWPAF